jgi:hypothetical protein
MAIALVGTPTQSSWGTANTSRILAPGQNTTIGNKVIAAAMFDRSVSSITCSDNSTQAGTANSYTEIGTFFLNSTVGLTVWWTDLTRSILTTDRVSFGWTTSAANQTNVSEWSGVKTGAEANTNTHSGTGTAQNAGALSAATAGDLVLGFFVYGTAIAYTVGTDGQGNTMTSLHAPTAGQSRSSLGEYLIESGTSAYTPACTVASGTSNYAGRSVRFNAAAAGPQTFNQGPTATQGQTPTLVRLSAKILIP